ncbi:MAG: hypothetical protein Q8P83_03900 [bacterium]|nr:hypothetical protein [bacterium]
MLLDFNFWFVIPSFILTQADRIFGYVSAGLLVVAVIIKIISMFVKHPVIKKLLKKFFYPSLTIGLLGLFWFALRHENTPIFSTRFWVGITMIAGIVWLGFVFKYLAFSFSSQRREYDSQVLKNKYIPGKKR